MPFGDFSDFDRLDDFVACRVDDAELRGGVASNEDGAIVGRHHHPMRAFRHRNCRDDLACSRVNDAHRAVGEVADVGFWSGDGDVCTG